MGQVLDAGSCWVLCGSPKSYHCAENAAILYMPGTKTPSRRAQRITSSAWKRRVGGVPQRSGSHRPGYYGKIWRWSHAPVRLSSKVTNRITTGTPMSSAFAALRRSTRIGIHAGSINRRLQQSEDKESHGYRHKHPFIDQFGNHGVGHSFTLSECYLLQVIDFASH